MKTILSKACLLSVMLFPLTGHTAIVAFDMVGSSNMNLMSFSNPFNGAFASAGDGFQRYQRGVSASIPFSVLDDSLIGFPSDNLGIIDENNNDEFFGVTDTQNGDNDGPVSATWVFDISGFSDLSLSLDVGAMGDFESSDFFSWDYSIDGGTTNTAFANTVDEAGSNDYTLAGGGVFTLSDPMLLNGIVLSNELATFIVPLIGSGSELTLTLTAMTDGGSEAFAFQNLVIEGTAAVVPVPAAVWLFVSALSGIGFLRRRSRPEITG